jgi:pimeloyl-ACP methyl ester carboxylesterase
VLFRSIRFYDLFSRTPGLALEQIRCPVLVIGGAQDVTTSPEDCQALVQRMAHAHLHVLPDCGHFAMLESPYAAAAVMRAFVAEQVGAQEAACVSW